MSWFRPKKPASAGPAAGVAALGAPVAALPEGRDDELEIEADPPASAPSMPVSAPTVTAPARSEPVFDGSGGTRLGDDTHITGGVVTASDLWIAGRIDGDIASGATVVVAADGTIVGNVGAVNVRIEAGGTVQGMITADNVTIGGVVNGPVRAAARLAIATSGRVIGDVSASAIQIDDGATLQGRCTMARAR